MLTARIVVGIALALLWLNVAGFNAYVLYLVVKRAEKRPSFGPILGALVGPAAIFVLPFPGLYQYWWVPIVFDIGTWWLMFSVMWLLLSPKGRKMWRDQ
jgi:hypothetical protein